MIPPAPVSTEELLRLFDGELSDAETRAVQARLSDPDRETLAAWTAQRDQLRKLGQTLASDSFPPDLRQAMQHADQAHGRMAQWLRWQRWGGMAATVVLAFGLGWLTRGTQDMQPASQQAWASFPRQAALAYVAYTPEQKHPVEVTAEQQTHLVQWLSKRLGRTLQIPRLNAQGYELMGGRLLPGDNDGVRAQFMYQRADGLRVTLYVGAISADSARPTDAGFALAQHGSVSSFYWVDQGFGYALSAALPQAELQALAQSVYHQL